MKKIKVFLDDIRTPPAGWILVHWPNEAMNLLQEFDVEEISLAS
ncbi:cyclic-phosphate processing receiver domain-containing protein [Pseudomonas syringae]